MLLNFITFKERNKRDIALKADAEAMEKTAGFGKTEADGATNSSKEEKGTSCSCSVHHKAFDSSYPRKPIEFH
jgi:hypothetical protein